MKVGLDTPQLKYLYVVVICICVELFDCSMTRGKCNKDGTT